MLHRNDGIFNGILNEIASSFVLLTPRNDGILNGILNGILDGILNGILNEIASLRSQ